MSSLALVAGNDRDRTPDLYRFTVRCDRAMNRRIEIAARKAGVSPTSFVQQHFETILDAATPAKPALLAIDPIDFARRNGVTLLAARLWIALSARADVEGRVTVSRKTMAGWLGCASPEGGGSARKQLVKAGLLAEESLAGRDGTTYRVKGEDE